MILPARQLIGLTVERFEVLACPRLEVSPVARGATIAEWAELAGVHNGGGGTVHRAVADELTETLDTTPHHPTDIAHRALQRLTNRSITERVRGVPMRYRPVIGYQRGR